MLDSAGVAVSLASAGRETVKAAVSARAAIDRLIIVFVVFIAVLPSSWFPSAGCVVRSSGPGRKIAPQRLKNLYRPAETL
jgi:hypothetical protein